ncbi:hypothetical protein JB92DRAFT_3093495 [Gautieria morchelliformis]|nr:hypothetical protein JB92DRAFT_3093495 [Gautieria morchelliformis]
MSVGTAHTKGVSGDDRKRKHVEMQTFKAVSANPWTMVSHTLAAKRQEGNRERGKRRRKRKGHERLGETSVSLLHSPCLRGRSGGNMHPLAGYGPHLERHGAISDPLDDGVVKTIASERQEENRRAIGGKERKENAGQDNGADRPEKRQGEGKKKENTCQDDGAGRHGEGFSRLLSFSRLQTRPYAVSC